MNMQELDRLIARYFDGETTLDEERKLRKMLASPDATENAADEARAVMGIFAAQRTCKRVAAKHHKRLSLWHAAAGMAILLAAGAALLHIPGKSVDNICIAYCGGSEISDHSDVLAIMDADLSAMACAAGNIDTSIEDDFGAIINAINTSNQ